MKTTSKPPRSLPLFEMALLGALLAAGIYSVYQFMHAQSAVSTQAGPSPHQTVTAATSPSATARPAGQFDVPELGIKMILPSGLSGLTYTISPNQSGTFADGRPFTATDAHFTTDALQRLDPECSAANNPFGEISRYSADPRTTAAEDTIYRDVGTIYLSFTSPQSTCSDKPDAQKLETSLIPLLRQAFESATPL